MARITFKQVNAALKAAGIDAELVQGDGYLWFDGDEASQWYSSSVAVFRLNHIPDVQWWVREYEHMRKQNKDR